MNTQTPMSFITALFSIPSQQYPYNGNIDWKLWHIAVGMGMFFHSLSTWENMHGALIHLVVPESITFLIVLIYWIIIRHPQGKDEDNSQDDSSQDDNSQDDHLQDGTNLTSSGKQKWRQNWWQKISKPFQINEDNSIPGDTAAGAMPSESSPVINLESQEPRMRHGSLRPQGKREVDVDVSQMA
jgi:hypothetical protein